VNARTGDNDIYAQTHQLGGDRWQPIHVAVCIPALEADVASFDVAELAQPFFKRIK